MAISEVEFAKEEKILKKVKKLLGETLDSLGEDVLYDEENLVEFKKMMWENANSFDEGEMQQVMSATSDEEQKALQKQNYFKKLCSIRKKPYFASIVFKDDEGSIFNIYMSLTYLKDKGLFVFLSIVSIAFSILHQPIFKYFYTFIIKLP